METTEILRHILSCQGSVDREELECNLGDASFIAEIITNNNEMFVSCWFDGTQRVVVQSPVQLCRNKECFSDCGGLHVCKNLLLSGDCHFLQRRGCSFSHDLQSESNMEVLRDFSLETLSRSELCLLLLQSNNTLLPAICHDYNNRNGCRGGSQGVCPRLHICERYLSRVCNCPRTHDFSEPQPLKLLQDKNIPEHLFKVLKSIYANKQALRQAERGKVNSSLGISEAVDCSLEDQIPTEHWTTYDSDSSHSSVSTNQSESSNPRKKEGRRRGGRNRTPKTTSSAGGVRNKNRHGSQGPKNSEERRQPRSKNPNPTSNSCNTAANKSDAKSEGKQSQGKRDKAEICMFFIRGSCRDQGACPKTHDLMPYRWEIKQDGRWIPMADNEKIEEDYCDPQNMYSTTCPPVHFQVAQDGRHTMMCGTNKVRRVSTVNSVLKPHYSYTTDWLWYFKDEKGQWNQYSAATNLVDNTKQQLIIITSEELEQRYLKNNQDIVMFSSNLHSYILTFRDMIQTNLKYCTVRLVRRRPRFVSAAEVDAKRKRDKTQIRQTEHMNDTSMKTDTFSTSSQQITLVTTLNKPCLVSATSSSTSKIGPELATASAIKSQFTLPAPEALTISTTKSSNPMVTSGASLKAQPTSRLSQFPTAQATKLATASQVTLTATLANTTSETNPQVTTLQIANAPTPPDQISVSSEAQVTATTTLITNSQFIFPQTCPTTFGASPVKSASNSAGTFSPAVPMSQFPSPTPQAIAFDSATLSANKMSTKDLAFATKPSNPFSTDLSPLNSQLKITESQFTLGTATKMTTIPQFTSSTKSSNPFLTDVSSNAQLTATKSKLAFSTPQNISNTAHASSTATKSGGASMIATTSVIKSRVPTSTLQFGSEANSPDTCASTPKSSTSKSQPTVAASAAMTRRSLTTTARPESTASKIHSSNTFSSSSATSQLAGSSKSEMTIPTTPATKSATISEHSLTTSTGNVPKQFPSTTAKSPVTSPKTATESQFEAVRSAGTSFATNTQVVKFSSASPLGYAAVSFSGATTSATGSTTVSSTATKKINEQQKNCVIL